MVYIRVDNVTVEFPIYNASTRSLKHKVINFGTGGRLSRDASNRLAVVALRDVSAALAHGDRVALVGRNGAGKTTLLRVLAGVYEPSFGTVTCQGQVASLFDVTLGMDIEGTGYENIIRRGMLLGLTPKQIDGRLDDIIEFTELGDYLAVPVRTYSSGMLLRLAFAISTTIEPEILLMDEWIAAGDSQFMKKAEARLESLVRRSGIMVIASHSNALVRQVCNKAILLEKGQVVQAGPVEEVVTAYEEAKPPE
jgi:ABC-2 type transport system ATP-binding protein/lipopolysaccharide transport system ATP-binding protein